MYLNSLYCKAYTFLLLLLPHPYGRLLLLPLFLPFSLSLLPPNTHIYNSRHHWLVYSYDDCLQHMFTVEERKTSRRHESTAVIGNVLHTCDRKNVSIRYFLPFPLVLRTTYICFSSLFFSIRLVSRHYLASMLII